MHEVEAAASTNLLENPRKTEKLVNISGTGGEQVVACIIGYSQDIFPLYTSDSTEY